jgi:hypothetical protein
LQKLSREYNRLIFDVVFNNNVIAYTEADLLYAVGLSAYLSSHKEVTSDDIKKRSQDEVDKMALEGLKSLGNSNFNVEVELLCGGEAYSGYDPEDPKNIIYCVTQGKTQEITLRLQEHIKKSNPDLYKFFEPMVKVLTRPREVRVNAEISNSFNFSKEIQPAKIKFRAARAEAA